MTMPESQSVRAHRIAEAHEALLSAARALRERAGTIEGMANELCDLLGAARAEALALGAEAKLADDLRDALLSIEEVSDKLGVSRQTLWRMRRSGELPSHIMVGQKMCWKRSELDAWLEQRRGRRRY